MAVLLVGANPGVRLYDGDRLTAYASVWQVDWSAHGSGAAIVLWHEDRVRVLATEARLGHWLERSFTRHFPETDGLAWPEPEPVETDVDLTIDLEQGLVARADDVEVRMAGPLDRRPFHTDDFPLDGRPHALQLLLAPMGSASIVLDGAPVPGGVRVEGTPDRPASSAFVAVAEVWSSP